MAALSPGAKAPPIELPTVERGSFSLQQSLQRGPVLAGFFKVTCPVCHLTFPYVERIYQAVKGSSVTVVGISQDDRDATRAFNREFGLTFPVAMDELRGYPVSNAYGLTNVPSLFLIEPDGKISASVIGWSRREIEDVGRVLAQAAGVPVPEIIRKSEQVPEFKPG